MFNIHRDIYIKELAPRKQSIQKANIVHYVNALPERLLMYCLNLKHRKTDEVQNQENNPPQVEATI
jgi:hypothetical protein